MLDREGVHREFWAIGRISHDLEETLGQHVEEMSTQIKKSLETRSIAGVMTNWAYAQLTWPIILTVVGALPMFRANQGHYAT